MALPHLYNKDTNNFLIGNGYIYYCMKLIREFDDFEWTKQPLNPWLMYDGIIFDIEPTEDEVDMYIEMALNTKKFLNRGDWGGGREDDINNIINYQKRRGQCALAINRNGFLTYSNDLQYYNGKNLIKYSQLINQEPLTESIDDDWGWAKLPLINPWVAGYTGIHFDIDLTNSTKEEIKKVREDVNQLVDMCLNHIPIKNASAWTLVYRENDINDIVDKIIKGVCYLAIEDCLTLSYASRNDYPEYSNVKWIKYSHLIGDNQLTESDGLDWIRDTKLNLADGQNYLIDLTGAKPHEKLAIQRRLLNMGFRWHSGDTNIIHRYTAENYIAYSIMGKHGVMAYLTKVTTPDEFITGIGKKYNLHKIPYQHLL